MEWGHFCSFANSNVGNVWLSYVYFFSILIVRRQSAIYHECGVPRTHSRCMYDKRHLHAYIYFRIVLNSNHSQYINECTLDETFMFPSNYPKTAVLCCQAYNHLPTRKYFAKRFHPNTKPVLVWCEQVFQVVTRRFTYPYFPPFKNTYFQVPKRLFYIGYML